MWQGDVSFTDSLIISLTGLVVVMLELILIAVFIVLLSKFINAFRNRNKPQLKEPDKKSNPLKKENRNNLQKSTKSDGEIDITDVPEEEMAVTMSSVSAQSGIALDKIRFVSIKKL